MGYKICRALLSVSDKTGLIELAKALVKLDVELISTGGTAKAIREAGLLVKDISEITGFPEIMGGRVKTLHPKVHGGLLSVRDNKDHEAAQAAHDISNIDLLVVNLYPFEATVKRGADLAEIIENIDIGGPAMTRAAAKNHAAVTVVCDPEDYQLVLDEMASNNGATSHSLREKLAAKAFARTAAYDASISNYLSAVYNDAERNADSFPASLTMQYKKVQNLRYGENPHQKSAFYVSGNDDEASIATARQLQGKELSYNNIADTDAALECVKEFNDVPACVIVKHANPCGVAQGENLLNAYERAYETDSESAFGGIIAFNRELDGETMQAILAQQFVEVIIAPKISAEAVQIAKPKQNIRVLECGQWPEQPIPRFDYKKVVGGLLVQDCDLSLYDDLQVVTRRSPGEQEMQDMIFAWKVAKFVKSNAIVYARDCATIGVGAGQMSRVNSVRIAAIKAAQAQFDINGTVMASDAFFPFADGLLQAVKAGVRGVIQPGGAMRDDEVIEAANDAGIAMIFTGMRHFRH